MEGSFFPWLDKIFEYIWQFVPRPYLVIWTCRAVRYRRGKPPVLVKPGVRWYWPLTTQVKVINIMVRAEEFLPSTYTTRDSKPFMLGYTMVYTVDDPVLADSCSDNYEQTIGELAEAVISPTIASHTQAQLLDMISKSPRRGSLDAILSRKVRVMAKEYGVKVQYCRAHTFAPTRVITLNQQQREL